MNGLERKIKDGMYLSEILDAMSEGDEGSLFVLTNVLNYNMPKFRFLDSLQIRGKEISTLYEKCCQGDDKESRDENFNQTLQMFESRVFSQDLIHKNLQSQTPIPFIDSSVKIEGISSYRELNPINKHWLHWCQEQKKSFIKRLLMTTK